MTCLHKHSTVPGMLASAALQCQSWRGALQGDRTHGSPRPLAGQHAHQAMAAILMPFSNAASNFSLSWTCS
jgi:hypothetical protein